MGCIRNALKRREWSVILYISSVFTVFLHLEYTLIFPVLDHSAYINQQHVTVCGCVACITTCGCGKVAILLSGCEKDVLRHMHTNRI